MKVSSEINAIYYAIRLISHKADVSQIRAGVAAAEERAEFGREEVGLALYLVETIESREGTDLRNIGEAAAGSYVSFYSDKIEELANEELADFDFDMDVADQILERLRAVGVGASASGGLERGGEARASERRSETRVLIVDDAPDVSEMLAVMLRFAGYEVTTASSGEEALESARAHTFDLIVSDIGMPGMNGYELARALRGLPAYQSVPLVAVGGFTTYDDRSRAREVGFDDFLSKPINPSELIDTAKRLASVRADMEGSSGGDVKTTGRPASRGGREINRRQN